MIHTQKTTRPTRTIQSIQRTQRTRSTQRQSQWHARLCSMRFIWACWCCANCCKFRKWSKCCYLSPVWSSNCLPQCRCCALSRCNELHGLINMCKFSVACNCEWNQISPNNYNGQFSMYSCTLVYVHRWITKKSNFVVVWITKFDSKHRISGFVPTGRYFNLAWFGLGASSGITAGEIR